MENPTPTETQILGLSGKEVHNFAEELGKATSPAQRVKTVRAIAHKAVSGTSLNREEKRFLQLATKDNGGLKPEERTMLDNGTLQMVRIEKYIRKTYTAGSTRLLEGLTTNTVGVTNFKRPQLEPTENLTVTHISVRGANDASGTAVAAGGYTNDGSAVETALRNGELEIMVDGKKAFSTPLAGFFTDKTAVASSNQVTDEAYVVAITPFLIPAEATIEIEVRTADGVSLTASRAHAVEVRLRGIGTKQR